jgi:hypothetical protein
LVQMEDDDDLPFVSRPKKKAKGAKAIATTVSATYDELSDVDTEAEGDDPGPEMKLAGA